MVIIGKVTIDVAIQNSRGKVGEKPRFRPKTPPAIRQQHAKTETTRKPADQFEREGPSALRYRQTGIGGVEIDAHEQQDSG